MNIFFIFKQLAKRTGLLILFLGALWTDSSGQAPAWAWAEEAYTFNNEFAKNVAVDPVSGDIVVVGHFTGDISAF